MNIPLTSIRPEFEGVPLSTGRKGVWWFSSSYPSTTPPTFLLSRIMKYGILILLLMGSVAYAKDPTEFRLTSDYFGCETPDDAMEFMIALMDKRDKNFEKPGAMIDLGQCEYFPKGTRFELSIGIVGEKGMDVVSARHRATSKVYYMIIPHDIMDFGLAQEVKRGRRK